MLFFVILGIKPWNCYFLRHLRSDWTQRLLMLLAILIRSLRGFLFEGSPPREICQMSRPCSKMRSCSSVPAALSVMWQPIEEMNARGFFFFKEEE